MKNLKEEIETIGLENVVRILKLNPQTLKNKIECLDFTVGEFFKLKKLMRLENEIACKIFNI